MSRSALPPDVRRWLCPADRSQIISGLCPWSELSPSDLLGQGHTKGIAQNVKGIATAGHSHRLTSGGKAEAALTQDF
jgi:hypothetical protein